MVRLLGAGLACASLAACHVAEQDAVQQAHDLARLETALVVAEVDEGVRSPIAMTDEGVRSRLGEAGRIYDESTSGDDVAYDVHVVRFVETGGGWTAESGTAHLCFRVSVRRTGEPGASHEEIDCPAEVRTTATGGADRSPVPAGPAGPATPSHQGPVAGGSRGPAEHP